MELTDQLAAERRARLAAERLLEQMKGELYGANHELSTRARELSSRVASSREEAEIARSTAETFRTQYESAKDSLASARSEITIAERRLWSSLETIRDGFAVFDATNTLVAANRAYLSLFDGLEMVRPGITMPELVALMCEEGLIDPAPYSPQEWRRMMVERVEASRIDHVVVKMWNRQYIKLIDRRTRNGDLVTLALNITDQMEREEQLQVAREKAEAANRAKSAFLANMSHEIRTPMNGVIAMAELLAESALSEEQQSLVETIRSSGEALLVIINDVLDYSKIEAEKISLKLAPFDLERCLHDVVTLLQPGVTRKGLQLAVDYDLFIPTQFTGDAGRIRQVLMNLVGNAVKFTNDGHIAVRVVGLPSHNENEVTIHVTVEDTGIGIPQEKLSAVFGEFEQVESDRNRQHDGTGLGLAITKRLVGLMGGETWVESREGEGSVFGFSLPLVSEAETPGDIDVPDWVARALLVGPAGLNRSILAKQLGHMGVETRSADTLDALVKLQPDSSDLIFLDAAIDRDRLDAIARDLRKTVAPAGLLLLVDGTESAPAASEMFDAVMRRPVPRCDLTRAFGTLSPFVASVEQEPAAADEKENVVPLEPARPDPAERARLMRVLVAEDNKTNRFVIEKMVQPLNIDLVFAENGLELVDHFGWQRPDIIFTDISMPKMDGKEAAKRIREIEADAEEKLPPCPIVAITAHAMEGDAEEILAGAIDDYLSKPVKKQALIDHILAAQPDGTEPVLPQTEAATKTASSS